MVKIRKGCGCTKNCLSRLGEEMIIEHVLNIKELSRQEKDMFIMGQMYPKCASATTRKGERKWSKYVYRV